MVKAGLLSPIYHSLGAKSDLALYRQREDVHLHRAFCPGCREMSAKANPEGRPLEKTLGFWTTDAREVAISP